MTWDEIQAELFSKYPQLLSENDADFVVSLTNFCFYLYQAGSKRGQEIAAAEIRKMLERLNEASLVIDE